MKQFIEKLIAGEDLGDAEMETAFDAIMSGQVGDIQIGAFLTALRAKGEKPSEIAAAVRIMRAKVVKVPVDFDVLDTCGTGGDGASTFNISTAVAFVMAGAGVKVAKHGNRSVSSSSGSADCLEALGVPIDLDPDQAAHAIRENGFAFMFAPRYHPSMKYAMPARKELGMKTVFNILGPLTNPAGAAYQVIGVYKQDLIDPVIEVLRILGSKGALVVHSGMDEVSVTNPTRYARLAGGVIERGVIRPEDAGLSSSPSDDLRVDTPRESADRIMAVFDGSLDGACLDSILLNAGAAFMALEPGAGIRDGVVRASEVIRSGKAMEALRRVMQ
jgi:anthranilate phosphoribosyltransferase